MTWLFILLLAATWQARAEGNPGQDATSTAATTNAIEAEYRRIEAADDAAQAEVDKWVKESGSAKSSNPGLGEEALERRIKERMAPIQKAYEDFLKHHPDHAKAHLAYGCFLNDRQDETGAQVQWEQALALDPSNPDVYNNLAGRYSETGPAKKAFEYYEKAIALDPKQALYYHNFANTLYVLRKRAMVHYGLDEQQVLAKVIRLYSNSAWFDTRNVTYAKDLAQTYYSLRPFPAHDALGAWTNALSRAGSEEEREELFVHLARATMLSGRLVDARNLLHSVTNQAQSVLKSNLLHSIEQREQEAATPNPLQNKGP